jgi:hypothetical protein
VEMVRSRMRSLRRLLLSSSMVLRSPTTA